VAKWRSWLSGEVKGKKPMKMMKKKRARRVRKVDEDTYLVAAIRERIATFKRSQALTHEQVWGKWLGKRKTS